MLFVNISFPKAGTDLIQSSSSEAASTISEVSPTLAIQRQVAVVLRPHMSADGLVTKCLEQAGQYEHIMDFTRLRALGSMFTMLNQCVRNVLVYNQQHDFPLNEQVVEKYVEKSLVLAMLWSFTGDCKLRSRVDLGDWLRSATHLPMPTISSSSAVSAASSAAASAASSSSSGQSSSTIIDFEVQLTTGEWSPWLAKVPQIEVETHKVNRLNMIFIFFA